MWRAGVTFILDTVEQVGLEVGHLYIVGKEIIKSFPKKIETFSEFDLNILFSLYIA